MKQRKSKQDPTLVKGEKIIKIRVEINEIETKRYQKKKKRINESKN